MFREVERAPATAAAPNAGLPFFADEIEVPAELDVTDFNGVERDDDTFQTTYEGWPLYYYFKDEAPGDVKGRGVGVVWFVVSPKSVPTE